VQVGSQAMADRYAYVPFIGLFIIIAWGAEQISSKIIFLKRLFIFAAAFIILMLTVATYNQIKIWRNTVTLFEDALKKTTNNYVAYDVLGFEAARENKNEEALMNYYMAQKINPKFYPAYNNAGIILIRMGRRYEALKSFERVIQLNKFSAQAYYNIGLYYLKDNNLDKSIAPFVKAIEIKPDYAEAYNNLGIVFVKKGMIREGILQFEKSLHINPYYKEAQANLQIAIAMQKEK
jgi:tetratricopeptide (TPR) repeat protein